MSYYTKTFYSRSKTIQNRLYSASGSIVSQAPVTVTSKETAFADWSRPKPNPLTDTTMTIDKTKYNESVIKTLGPGGAYYIGSYMGRFYSSNKIFNWSGDSTTASQQALKRFYNGPVNAAMLVGEAKSSLSMILRRSNQVIGLFSDVENLNFKGLAQQGLHIHPRKQRELRSLPKHKRMANAYLEVKFGWLPLLSDLFNLADGVRSSLKTVGTEISASGKSRPPGGFGSYNRVTIKGRVTNTAVRSLTELGFTNPLSVAWELVPFSFVIDYFLGIGNSLAGIPFASGTSFITGSVTTSAGSVQIAGHDGVVWYLNESINRKPVSLTTIQQSAVNFGVKNELSISYTTAANLIALGFQRWR